MKELKTAKFWIAAVVILFNLNAATYSHTLMGQIAHTAIGALVACMYVISQSYVETTNDDKENTKMIEAIIGNLETKEEE